MKKKNKCGSSHDDEVEGTGRKCSGLVNVNISDLYSGCKKKFSFLFFGIMTSGKKSLFGKEVPTSFLLWQKKF